jgi:hypothetical protein
MRNEFAEEFLPAFMSPGEPNREKEQVKARRNGGRKGKTRERSMDGKSSQAKQTGEAARRSRLVRGRGFIPVS